jgi:CMP-N-acetylneuraminic acid synthetase
LTRVIPSTDDEEIARVARACGIQVPFSRPADLARDETPMVDVLCHALSWLEAHEGYRPDLVVLLQPTSPLRRAEHIDAAVDLLIQSGADTVVSVVEVPHQFNPVSVMRAEGSRLVPFLEGRMILRRQDKPQVYARNGPAVLVVRREVVERGELYGRVVRPLVMSLADSVDIDSAEDLALAEFWLGRRGT